VDKLFRRFDTMPLAAASIAQVHAAELPDGSEVIVKVLRPDMRAVIARDVEVLYALARLADRYSIEGRRLRPVEVIREYEKTILDELDLMREAANAANLRRNFEGDNRLYVPAVHWDLCRRDVMVMERIRGVPISEVERLRELGADIPKLAENGVTIFFTQVFSHNFFHADMHPGNIFVDVSDPANPRYAAVDFGIVGTLDPRDQLYLAGNFLAFFERDYRKVAVLHLESGWVPAGTRVDELESAVRTLCEPIFNKPLKEISFGLVLLHLFEVARRFQMQIQPQLILLQKTLLNIEGLGRQLYPELDLWKTALPILRNWMRERNHPRALLGSLREHWPDIAEAIKVMPVIARRAVRRAYDDEIVIRTESASIERLRAEMKRDRRSSDAIIAGAAVFIGGIIWLALATRPIWAGWLFLIGGALWLITRLRK
jgi:ubiquinone biosynthesis protein